MRYDEFKARISSQPLISRQYLDLLGLKPGFWVQFQRWVKAGKILKLRKGLYLLNEADRRITLRACSLRVRSTVLLILAWNMRSHITG